MTLYELVNAAYENSKAHGFHDGEETDPKIPEKLCLIHAEVSEALEHYREGNDGFPIQTIWTRDSQKPDGFAVELADIVIRIGDLCGALGIDLESAVKVKMEYNKSRPFKHGKVC